MFYVVAYDVRDDKKRGMVSTTLLDIGIRVQYSVFEAQITQKLAKEYFSKLTKVLNRNTDRLIVSPAKEITSFSDIKLSISKNLWIV